MALIKCIECGKEFSNRAKSCPNCGCPIEEIINNIGKITIMLDDKEYDVTHIVELINNDKFNEAADLLQEQLDKDGFGSDDADYICEAIEDGNFSPWVYDQELGHLTYTKSSQPTPQPAQNVPQCPTCHSTNIERISSGKKTGGFLGLGVLNSNFKKMFKCNNCGYKW